MRKTIREEMLAEAGRLTGSDRNKEYGDPMANLGDTARLVNAYLASKLAVPVNLNEEDVAHLMVLIKIARTMSGNVKEDTYIDAAAYAAIAGEMAVRRKQQNDKSPMKKNPRAPKAPKPSAEKAEEQPTYNLTPAALGPGSRRG